MNKQALLVKGLKLRKIWENLVICVHSVIQLYMHNKSRVATKLWQSDFTIQKAGVALRRDFKYGTPLKTEGNISVNNILYIAAE